MSDASAANERPATKARVLRTELPAGGSCAGPYDTVQADHLAPRIDPGRFASGQDGHVVALEAGEIALPMVACHVLGRGRNRHRYVALPQSEAPIQRPIGMPEQGPGFLPSVTYPALTVSQIVGATCLPGGIALRDEHILLESFSAPWEAYQHRHLIRDDQGRWFLDDHRTTDRGEPIDVDGSVLFLDNQHVDWFGHFMLDVLTRAWAYEFCRSFLRISQLRVVCSRPPPFGARLFAALGVPARDLIIIDRPVRCERLLVATKALQIQHYVTPVTGRLWSGIGHRIAPDGRGFVDRIYVSRRINPTRALVEEERVERMFERHGFVVIHPESLDIADQIRLFAGARLIAGCSGSNMFNLAYQRRAKAVMLLVSPLLVHYSEQFLATGFKSIELDVVIGETDPGEVACSPGNVHAPWHVDCNGLADIVETWVARHA